MTTPTSPEGRDEPRYGRRVDPQEQPYDQQPPLPTSPPSTQPAGQAYGGPPGYGHQPAYGGAPGYGQEQAYGGPPGYGGSPGYGTTKPLRRTGAVLSIVIGALLMIGAPVGGLIMGAIMALGGFSGITDMAQIQTVDNGGTVALEANSDRAVFVESRGGERMSCDITGPNGNAVAVSGYHLGAPDGSGTALTGVSFRTGDAGDYTVDCDVPPRAEEPLMVSEPLSLDDFAGAGIVIIVGFLVGLAGLVLLVIGIVWLVRVNRRRREARGW